jgi:hypothetical protein
LIMIQTSDLAPAEENKDICWWNSISSTGGSNPTFSTSAIYSTSCASDPGIYISATDTSGNNLTGLAVSVYNSANQLVASGYTPLSVGVTTGGTYYVDYDNYGSNHLTSVGDYLSVTSYSINPSWGGQATISVPSTGSITVNGYYATNSGSSNNLQVSSADLNGNPLTGFYMQLDQNGQQINQGYTPVTFSSLSAGTYKVYANSYCNTSTHTNYTPSRWGDGTTGISDTISLNYNTNIKVYYSTSSC